MGLLDILSLFASDSETEQKNDRSHRHNGSCDGDCSNCPAHYGYRYGRWYYGHHHTHGCEFGGNGSL